MMDDGFGSKDISFHIILLEGTWSVPMEMTWCEIIRHVQQEKANASEKNFNHCAKEPTLFKLGCWSHGLQLHTVM